jgi:hypothetical protein
MGALLSPVAVDLHQASQSKPEQARASQQASKPARVSRSVRQAPINQASRQAGRQQPCTCTCTCSSCAAVASGERCDAVLCRVAVQERRAQG